MFIRLFRFLAFCQLTYGSGKVRKVLKSEKYVQGHGIVGEFCESEKKSLNLGKVKLWMHPRKMIGCYIRTLLDFTLIFGQGKFKIWSGRVREKSEFMITDLAQTMFHAKKQKLPCHIPFKNDCTADYWRNAQHL